MKHHPPDTRQHRALAIELSTSQAGSPNIGQGFSFSGSLVNGISGEIAIAPLIVKYLSLCFPVTSEQMMVRRSCIVSNPFPMYRELTKHGSLLLVLFKTAGFGVRTRSHSREGRTCFVAVSCAARTVRCLYSAALPRARVFDA